MTMLYPIVLETEEDGAVTAYVPGLPVYAAADTYAKAERAIRGVLKAYLHEHPASKPEARVRVARWLGLGHGERGNRRSGSLGRCQAHCRQGTRIESERSTRRAPS